MQNKFRIEVFDVYMYMYVVYFLYVNFLNIYWYVNICDNVMGFCDIYINK